MKYLLGLLLLVAVGCGRAPDVAVTEQPIPPRVMAAFENHYNLIRKFRDQLAMVAEGKATLGEYEESNYYANKVKRMDVWIRDFERAQDAKDLPAMLRRSDEMRAIVAEIEAKH
jgi:hypothetical protein